MAREKPPGPAQPPLTPEDRLLLCAARPRLSDEGQEHLRQLLAEPLDWLRLLDQAGRHGVAPLLYRHVRNAPGATVLPAALATLAEQSRICLGRNLLLRHKLVHLLGAFNRAGIPVMPLKGPWLSDLLYDDPGLRTMGDLDLLVQPDDRARGEALLLSEGIQLPASLQGAEYDTSFIIRNNVTVELHWDLTEDHFASLDLRELWASAERREWEGRTIWTMSQPDLLLYLCLHAVKDGLASLRTLLDITLVMERFGGSLPWREMAAQAGRLRIRTPVYVALCHARTLLGAPAPAEFLAAIRPPRGLAWRLSEALLAWRGGVLHARPDLLVGPVMAFLLFLWEDSSPGKFRHLRRNLWTMCVRLLRQRPDSANTAREPRQDALQEETASPRQQHAVTETTPAMNHALSLACRVRIPEGIASHDLQGETLVLNPTTGACVSLDPVGARMWFLLQAHRSPQKALDALVQEYEVSEAQGEHDLVAFVTRMRDQGFVETGDDDPD